MRKTITRIKYILAAFIAAVFALAVGNAWAANLYWKGGTGTEAEPADIYDPANWTTSSTYSGDSIASSPTSSDKLYFKFSALTYLTNSMANAASEAVCSEANFNGGDCVLVGAIRSASTFRLAQDTGSAVEVRVAEGGTLHSGGYLCIGSGGKEATLTVNGGTVYSGNDLRVGNNNSSTGTLNINGGTVKASRVLKSQGSGNLNFDGGTLQATANNISDFISSTLAKVNVLSCGGSIDANGKSVKIAKALTGEGAMTFKGGGTITLSAANAYEGGTTIELGTTVNASNATARDTILGKLVIDGRAVLEGKTYDVLVASGLDPATALDKVQEPVNCSASATVGFDNDETLTKIIVTLASPTVVNTTTPVMAFEGKSLNEIKYANFTSRMFGNYANKYNAIDSAKGCNKKLYYDEDGNLSSIIVEFQAYDGSNIRCVVVEFTDGEGGVYAKALGARYVGNAPLGYVFLEQNKTTWHGDPKVVTTSRSGDDYGACDFRWTQGEHSATAWTLDQDKTWSDLRNGATLAKDEIMQITVTDADAVLTVDEDVNVGLIEFVNGTGTTLKIAPNVTVSADNYIGLGFVLNNGTLQKWGEGTVEMKFDNASRGVFVVNAGTLKAAGKRADGAGSPIIGDPDVTPRSNYLIDVKSGATYDVNGQTSVKASVRLAEGAHFTSSAEAEKTYGQTMQLILAGNAEVNANGLFGLYASEGDGSRLDLGNYKLIVNGANNKEFMLGKTTIIGDGMICVESGKLCTRNEDSKGEDCTLSIGANGKFENNKHFKVKNFVNNGTISYASGWGRGELEVTGEFTSKTATFPKLTLTGATVKAATGAEVTVLDTFNSSDTVTIDASEITKAALEEAMETGSGVPLLTVPVANKGGAWTVANPPVAGAYVKWIDKGDSKSTLYLCKSKGTRIIIR